MRCAKQVLFTICAVLFLMGCSGGTPQTPLERAIDEKNETAKRDLWYLRKFSDYVYDSEVKMCFVLFKDGHRGSVAPVPCLNIIDKMSSEHRALYFSDFLENK